MNDEDREYIEGLLLMKVLSIIYGKNVDEDTKVNRGTLLDANRIVKWLCSLSSTFYPLAKVIIKDHILNHIHEKSKLEGILERLNAESST